MMQVFAANSLMQREFTPEANLMMFTVPYKNKVQKTSPLAVAVSAFNSMFFLFTLVPLVFYTAYSIIREKESGMRYTLTVNGLNRFTHFLSWLLHYTVCNFCISLLYTIGVRLAVFSDSSFMLLFSVVFMSFESFFGLVWAVQPFCSTSKMGIFATGFVFFLSFYGAFIIDQREPVIDSGKQMLIGLLPMTTVKRTFDILAQFYGIDFPMTFDNFELKKGGWSL